MDNIERITAKREDLLTRSPDIETMVDYWDRVTDILNGQSAIKNAGEKYLPPFPDEQSRDYDFRLEVGKFTNIYRDVTEGLASKPFQNEITLIGKDIPQEVIDFAEDVDGAGNNLTSFAALTFFNGINYAIDWIFVDYPSVMNPETLTIEQAKGMNLKPFWRHVLGKNVLDVKTRMEGSKQVITYFKVQEPGFGCEPLKIREFYEDIEGKIRWSLWVEDCDEATGEKIFVLEQNGVLSIDFIPMIPFITGRRDGNSFKFYPPMLDAANLQITLYQNESALEYIKTLACYPMLATNGTKPVMEADGRTPKKIAVGPNRVLYGITQENGYGGSWQYVEPNANSLEFLQKNIDKTKNDLRELGRQPLTALSTQLTTVTTSIAAGKAKSAVTAWAFALKDALENALLVTMKWMNKDYEPEVNVYTGFDNVMDDGSDLEELGKARERGDISVETYWDELKRRKVLSPEFNTEVERQRLLDEIPSETAPDIESESKAIDFNQEKEVME